MLGWHFTSDEILANGDGRQIISGETLTVDGNVALCRCGLHASRSILDALEYAPGNHIWRVELQGKIEHGDDKSVASERKALWGLNAEEVLRRFARRCALDVVHLWDVPSVVIRYLKTGDETPAAGAAAGAAAWAAAGAAAGDAAWAAAWATAGAAAGDAASAAAGAAAGDAAWAAAGAAARAAARAAAGDAAWAAARDAARAATRAAAWAAARRKQRRRLTSMVIHAYQTLT